MEASSLAKCYDPLFSSSPLASLDGFICNAASASCNQSERALQKAHVLLEKCQQNKNACTYKIML
jgi:hypothetical protein